MDYKHNLVPDQKTGIQKNISESVKFDRIEEAEQFFQVARKRLLDVNNWEHICTGFKSSFQLTDSQGQLIKHRFPQVGDYFRIDIPGPSSTAGDGYDWVKVEIIDEREGEMISIRVRPAPNPVSEKEDLAHFLDTSATSTFQVSREDNQVTAEVFGRNEKPNTTVDNLLDKARNLIVTVGNWLGFSDLQWKNLVEALVKY